MSPDPAQGASNLKILLVEDQDMHALLIQRHLSRLDPSVTVTRVADGAEAMGLLHAGRRFDLILLDIQLPEKDGREVLGELRADPDLRSIPVVVLTGVSSERERAGAYALGANAYVHKPEAPGDYQAILADVAAFWLRRNRYPRRSA